MPEIFKLTIYADERDPSKPLQVGHHPPILGSEGTKVAQAIRSVAQAITPVASFKSGTV